MKVRPVVWVFFAVLLPSIAFGSVTYSIDFTTLNGSEDFQASGLTSASIISNGGVNTISDPYLAIYGLTIANANPTPGNPFTGSATLSTVHWSSDLGDISTASNGGANICQSTSGQPCPGLGVGSAAPIISDLAGVNELLMFSFGAGSFVDASSIAFTLRGYDGAATDGVWVFVDYTSVADASFKITGAVGGDYNFTNSISLTSIGFGSGQANRFAILVNGDSAGAGGAVGVGGLSYTDAQVAPEPGSILTLLSGLGGLALWRRRRYVSHR